ncbi:hypothetical protein JIP62_03860 [Brevundimonas vitis]|uniref:Uncharacterized protein n=1 Tax=Brevundimonas vitisensis TaxID=2800818 RepID=A0ABX7BSF4_9CAUL|nr:hypothetical protein [Brevundimonas vitisensis]QQQ19261.1 hypothetical protein JIP62_03860 [Brevundimonas vitisensis]
MKSLVMGVLALAVSAGAAAAQSHAWEAVGVSEGAVMAVDWPSLSRSGAVARVTIGAVVTLSSADSPFDYATSVIDVDCADRSRGYRTIRSSFFKIDGTAAAEDFTDVTDWQAINDRTLMNDVKREVCASTAARAGPFDDITEFAVSARAAVAAR